MRLLVLGGTRFVGRAIVDEAVSRGYDVTTFSRGRSGHFRPGAEALIGDRTRAADLQQLAGREWDAAIDTSVLAPAHVAASARLLAGQVGHYTYVSSVAVYADHPAQPVTEESPLLEAPSDTAETVPELGYGRVKAGCERAVSQAMPGRCMLARPGPIVGPHENTGGLTWWLARFAAGGRVLAPGSPGRPVRLTDVRDLAAWLVDNSRRRIPGAINVPGPEGNSTGDLLAECARATGAGGRAAERRAEPAAGGVSPEPGQPAWVPDSVLLAGGLRPVTHLPLWAPDTPDYAGIWQVSGDRALRTGMRYRPLADTVRDTWLWLRQEAAATGRPAAEVARWPGTGLDPAREQQILAALP